MTSSGEEYSKSKDDSEYEQPQGTSSDEDRQLESSSEYHDSIRRMKGETVNQRVKRLGNQKIQSLKEEESEQMEGEGEEADQSNSEYPDGGIFFPDIELILWKRTKRQSGPLTNDIVQQPQYEYLVKYKDYSYLQCEWIDEKEVIAGEHHGRQKVNRFMRNFEKRLRDLEVDPDDEIASAPYYFDQQFVEVDRVLLCTEMFPVIHPKKAGESKGKWFELLIVLVSKLLAFSKDKVRYGVYFMEPVDPERDGCPNYRKIISQPMDLGTVLNRLYLEYYKGPQHFWTELGLVFKNCRKFNQDEESDIRVLADTLREAAILLYQQWHQLQTRKYVYLQRLQNYTEDETLIGEVAQNVALLKVKKKHEEQHEREQLKELFSYLHDEIQGDPLRETLRLNHNRVLAFIKSKDRVDIEINPEDFAKDVTVSQAVELFKKYLPLVHDDESLLLEEARRMAQQEIQQDFQTYQKVLSNPDDLELWNPGPVNFDWIQEGFTAESHDFVFVNSSDPQVRMKETLHVDTLYLIKWRGLSYLQVTWEPLSALCSVPQNKLSEFRQWNRALDRETRTQMQNDQQLHKTVLSWEENPKKKNKIPHSQYNEVRNQLYNSGVRNREPVRYTQRNQPVYRDRRLLRDYQLESLNWMIDAYLSQRNVLLADEMGLGKTVQAFAFLQHLYAIEGQRGPFLVVAPLSTLQHWKRTAEEWTYLNAVLYYDQGGAEGRVQCLNYEQHYSDITMKGVIITNTDLHKFQVLITSYEVFNSDVQQLLGVPFKFVIVDEAHRLKNQQAKILTALRRLPCKRVMLLTGTPVQNNTEELWSLLNYIEPQHFSNLELFKQDFGELTTAEQIEKLGRVLKPYILRRRKEDVEQSIPPLQENIIDIEMTTLQKTIYRALYEKNKNSLQKSGALSAAALQSACLNNLEMQLRKCCNHPMLIKELFKEIVGPQATEEEYQKILVESSGKMILLEKMLEKFIREGKKILIFSQFTQMLMLLEDFLNGKSIKYEKLTGDVKSNDRQNAIDRFNDPSRGRYVFLLSTKAGGQGINLTAAEVVIIYDSDWNPQNDVQATARAHRIGQEKEVAVYRLITKNTYESEMFEKATRKLGLDQALFYGTDFKQVELDSKPSNTNNNNKKLTKHEMEMLLKKGSLGLLEEFENEKVQSSTQQLLDTDIEGVLNNSRVAKYSLINGSYVISKTSYVHEKADQRVDINDPNFWQIVFKNQESKSIKLIKLLEGSLNTAEEQKQFMLQTSEAVNNLVEAKLSLQGFNADDEANIVFVLEQISDKAEFLHVYQNLAKNWLDEVNRPSRRFKKITAQDLEYKQQIQQEKITKPKPAPIVELEDKYNWAQGDEALKLQSKTNHELLNALCTVCERPRCTYFCMGFCRRAFHEGCRNITKDQRPTRPSEVDQDIEKVKKNIKLDYLCCSCSNFSIECFNCKKEGRYFPAQFDQSKTTFQEDENEDLIMDIPPQLLGTISKRSSKKKKNQNNNEMVKCTVPTCSKFYHFSCAQINKFFQILDGQKQRFKCPLHVCTKCRQKTDENLALLQCMRCPKAFHLKCLPKEVHKYNKKHILCDKCNVNNHKTTKLEKIDKIPYNEIKNDDDPAQPKIKKKVKVTTEPQKQEKEQKQIKKDDKKKDHEKSDRNHSRKHHHRRSPSSESD